MKNDSFGFHFSIFNVNFVAAQYNWNILANTNQITMPVWNVFICYSRSDIKHDDGAFTYKCKLHINKNYNIKKWKL